MTTTKSKTENSLNSPILQIPNSHPSSPCQICGCHFFWKSNSPIWRCYVCVTPASDRLIKNWLDLRSDDEKRKFQFRWPGKWDESWEEYLERVFGGEVGGGGGDQNNQSIGGLSATHRHNGPGDTGQPAQPLTTPAPDFDQLLGDRLFLGRDRSSGGPRWYPNVRELMGYGPWPESKQSKPITITAL